MFTAIVKAKAVRKGQSVILPLTVEVSITAQNKQEARDNFLLAFILRKAPFDKVMEEFRILGKIDYKIFATETN